MPTSDESGTTMRERWPLLAGVALAVVLLVSVVAVRSCSGEHDTFFDTILLKQIAHLEPETDGERLALFVAELDEGRTWASGDPYAGEPVEGHAFLGGYIFILHDGETQYAVKILDGKAVPFFSRASDVLLVSAYDEGMNPTIAPQTPRQQAALDAAKAEVAKVNPDATQGGIELYVVYFPRADDGLYRTVSVYADVTAGTYALGGTETR
ncbi:MAG: hypothetical protein JXA36_00605 [Coriobacteriia bacterium]|nr:hypothetical protein [Coriobacteriia bacterium]